MSGKLAVRPETSTLRLSGSDVLDAFLSGRNANTLEAYEFDLSDFARFVNAPSPSAAVDGLLAMGHGNANRVVLAYKADMMTDRKLATATVARRIASLRSMVKLARQIGRVEWTLDVESPKVTKYRDTTGPGLDGWFEMRKKGKELATTTDQGKRDVALLHLMHDSCLRRGECVRVRDDRWLGECIPNSRDCLQETYARARIVSQPGGARISRRVRCGRSRRRRAW